MVHTLKALQHYLLDKPFKLHTYNASLLWLSHVSDRMASWLSLMAEYRYCVVHIVGCTNSANFLSRKRFPRAQARRHTREPY